jgi:hypothetical protein
MRGSALRFLFPVMLLTLAGPTGAANSGYSQSLHLACLNDPFLSVSVSAPRHDRFIDIELGLIDPAGRKAGSGGNDNHPIPRSQYGKVVEIPSHPESSKAVAVEICGAMPGRYLISVSEHGTLDYRLTVRGDDGTESNYGNESEPVNLHADGDRMCRYRFNLSMEDGYLAIRWLDSAGHPLKFSEHPTCDVVPRA